ncbi:MAG: hypothetical protein ACTHVE_12105 [Senegalia sp. (in: firmicutes)]|uniref:hypothetical protein n=1 Tax=Senegalia sp. (in: firmicutes) TaxID=1924098 RepID=UPI003F97F1FD
MAQPYEWRILTETTKANIDNIGRKYSDFGFNTTQSLAAGGFQFALDMGVKYIGNIKAYFPIFSFVHWAAYGSISILAGYISEHINSQFITFGENLSYMSDYTKVRVLRKWRWTDRQGGFYYPTSDFKLDIVY